MIHDASLLLFSLGELFLFVGSSHPERDAAVQDNVQAHSSNNLTVQGSKTIVQSRSAVKKNLTPRTAGKAVPVARRTKIRNYNVKDDVPSTHR